MSSIAIVGAGVGGLAAAVSLTRAGHRVTVFEHAERVRDGGGALILWCNALKALGALGLSEALRRAPSVQEVEYSEFRRRDGEYLTNMPVGEISRRHDGVTVVLARQDLLATLYEAARAVADVRVGTSVASFEAGRDEVSVTLSNGARKGFDALIGADGIRSMVRRELGLDAPLRDLDQDLWVATTTHCPQGLQPGETIATVGAGQRFWHALLRDGRTFWYATLRTDDGARPPDDLDALRARFADWHAPIPDLIRHTDPRDTVRTPMRDRAPARPWGRGRVTLLGDAAHAMTPDLGQGACQAIESAVALGESFKEDDVAEGLRAYERARFQRTADINRMSFLVATTSSVTDPTECAVRDAAMRFGLRATAVSQLGWLFEGP